MSELSSSEKVDILISALEERYCSIRTMRERVQNICIWSLGLLAAASGWFLDNGTHLNLSEFLTLMFVILCAYGILRGRYFRDIETGFKKQLQAAAQIERALHLYDSAYFTQDKNPMYPEEWSKAGRKNGNGNYFRRSYELMSLGVLIFVVAVTITTLL